MNSNGRGFRNIIRDRQSSRHFSKNKIDKNTIEEIIEEASWSPSAGNRQPWRVVALSPEMAGRIIQQYEALSWETIYPVLFSVLEKDPRFLGREVTGTELIQATLDLVRKELFIQGEPWLLLIYDLKPRLRDVVHSVLSAIRIVFYRINIIPQITDKLKLVTYMLGSFREAMRTDRKTNESSLSNFLLSLHLAATDRGLASCIQFSWAMVEKKIKRSLNLEKRTTILGGLVIGHPLEGDDMQLQQRIRERKPVPIAWY